MHDYFKRIAGVTALVATTLAPAAISAQQRPAPQRVLSRGATDAVHSAPYDPSHRSDRMLYGRIDALRGATLLVRARSGRLVRVDASEAVRTDTYSAPLFVGKIVVIDGYYDASKTLHAKSVMRMGSLDASTAPDR